MQGLGWSRAINPQASKKILGGSSGFGSRVMVVVALAMVAVVVAVVVSFSLLSYWLWLSHPKP